MSLRDLYARADGDYETVMKRFRTEERLRRFVKRFPDDTSCESFREALGKGDMETAFREIHVLKGLCMNLGFSRLQKCSSTAVELLRPFSEGGEVPAQQSRDIAAAADDVHSEWVSLKNIIMAEI